MTMQSSHETSLRKYILAIASFIAAVTLCLAVFFISLFTNIDRTVERELWDTMVHQSNHINSSFDIRFQHLESAADFLSKQAEIHGEITQQYIQSLTENSSMQHAAVFDIDGNAVYENGDIFQSTSLDYIHLALKGERNVSDQTVSLVDGVMRFCLSVPIRRDAEVIGALSGSFNLDELGNLLFADRYEGQSILFIADADGHVLYSDTPSEASRLTVPEDLYSQLREATFIDGGNAEALIASFGRHETGMAQYRQNDGYTLFLLYTPITDSNLLLMHAIPRDVAFGQFGFVQTSIIIVGILILICVVLLVVYLIASSRHSERNLVRFAQTDPLTGLSNKQYTQEAIDFWLKSDACTGIQAMLFMDIDYFKDINDQYGHSVGDDALRFVGQALRQEFRSSDIIGRVGGDEFVIFMRNVPLKQVTRSHAASLCERMRNAEIEGLDKGELHCSIGIAYAPVHGTTYHDLSRIADQALYQTKERGRNGFSEYMDPAQQEQDED